MLARVGGTMVVLAGLACVALWVWPGLLLARPWRRPGPPPERIALLFAGDVRGLLEPPVAPCDCDTPRWGGIARISGLLQARTDPAPRLLFDVGDMTAGPHHFQQLGLETYLSALTSLGCPAERVLFFDDYQPNVDGAAAVGITAFKVSGPAEVRLKLRELKDNPIAQ